MLKYHSSNVVNFIFIFCYWY